MTGKAGLGVLVTGARLPMAAVRYWRTQFAFEALFGWTTRQSTQPTVSLHGGHLQPTAAGLPPSPEAVAACQGSVLDQRSSVACATDLELAQTRLSIGLLWRIADAPRASLIIGLRPWVQWSTQTEKTTTTLVYHTKGLTLPVVATNQPLPRQYGLEIPLIAEFFFNDHASMSGQVALQVGRGTAIGYPTTTLEARATDTSFLIGLRGSWSGGAGVTFYF